MLSAVQDRGLYPEYLLQLHAPVTYLSAPLAAALWVGTSGTGTLRPVYQDFSYLKAPIPWDEPEPMPPNTVQAFSTLRLALSPIPRPAPKSQWGGKTLFSFSIFLLLFPFC